MQMIENPWGVAVYGAATVKAQPDLVRIRFTVSRLEQAASTALATAGEGVLAVRAVLRAHGVPDAGVQSSQLSLRTVWTHSTSRRVFDGYSCEAEFVVESSDLDRVQPLLVELVAAGANEIEGVSFDVTGKPELRAEARRRAVAAARQKAELYAEAAGVRLGAVLHIDDVDPERSRSEFRGHGGGGQASADDFAPGHVVVNAAVVLGLAILQ